MVSEAKKKATEDRLSALTLPQGNGWLDAARKDALGRLRAVGLPAKRDEYWRFTDPSALVATAPAVEGAQAAADPFAELDPFVITVDGDAITVPDGAPEGLEIDTLRAASAVDIHWVRDVYGTHEAAGSRPVLRPLAMLNTAYATDGLLLRVKGAVARPVAIRYTPGTDPILHHVVKLEPGASLVLLESGTSGDRSNHVLEADLADDASFHHLRIQGPDDLRHVNTHVFAGLSARSVLKSFTLSANGALTRNEAVIEMTGDDGSATVAGAAFGRGAFHHDDTVFVTHDALNCESRQVFKKVLRDGATGVFQGKILVKEGAQKTDGYQISQSLLLDDDSVFLAKPELEIYADDVACSHGSTTGAIDETALFYLRSRGVSKRDATDMLVLSFLAEALDEIEDEALREHVTARLAGWLAEH
ncbi:Fe-S cluster assembly protein SufD [Jannaschia seohaensis]|uniref:Fe-S cluster assembly protein SufD n=2 Tax=Jannaschia seohaensis TaxID=475081 RepID=A0A2Y9A9R4_9RHOB|nr:SufD family Fe-S cluster assembly protein [Jannaschia seohaensis]PWJ20851.1 Fe-S cluster assembly protein SufD [Jannaschia seohaensis]SSA41261.1 Fe-S cluster assembly protein SufD [Jannaschia seohaensis]